MGNSSTTLLPEYSCTVNVSRDSVTSEQWSTHSLSSDFREGSITQAFILLLFLLIGAPSNVIIIVSIVQQKLYRQTTHILLLNLAISDLLTCVLVIPFVVVAGFSGGYVFGESDYVRCQVCQTGLIYTALAVFSVNVLGLMSLDRFIFIKFPLRYDYLVTVPRVIVVTILAWLLSIIESILPLAGFGVVNYGYSITACTPELDGTSIYYAILVVGLAFVPIIVTVVTNIWIACIVRKQIRKVYRTRRSFGNREELRQYNLNLRKQIRTQRNRKQLALIRAFGAILIANFVVWTPLVIFVVVSLIVAEDTIPLGLFILSYICLIAHSVLHPLIEGCFIPDIKDTFKKVLGIKYCERAIRRRKGNTDFPADSNASESATIEPDFKESTKCFCCHKRCCDICIFAVISESA